MIRGLPYDAELEYLESTGAQYVDTGVLVDSLFGFDITCAFLADGCVYGTINGTGGTGTGAFGYGNDLPLETLAN